MTGDDMTGAGTARQCRGIARAATKAALATGLPSSDKAGAESGAPWPYASLVLVAVDHDGSPLLMLSDLAEHTRALEADARCSLLFDDIAGMDDPLTGARLSILGKAERSGDPVHRARFLARHPSAAQYADFGDFAVWRVAPARAHLVAGFGRITWLPGEDYVLAGAGAAELRDAEPRIVEHMNADHRDALADYAMRLLGLGGGPWEMSGIDTEGMDLRAGAANARVSFESPVFTAAEARAMLVALAKKAQDSAILQERPGSP